MSKDTEQQETQARPPRMLDAKWDGKSNFNVDETAQILGLSSWATYEAVKRGELPAFKVGRRVIISRYVLERKMQGAA